MARVSGRTYFAISSLRSARMSRSGRGFVPRADSSTERHFIMMDRAREKGSAVPPTWFTNLWDYPPLKWRATFHDELRIAFCSRILHSWQLHPSETACEAGFAHLLEHLLHLGRLTQKIVHLLNAGPGAAGD